jgi:hypothetical protein
MSDWAGNGHEKDPGQCQGLFFHYDVVILWDFTLPISG